MAGRALLLLALAASACLLLAPAALAQGQEVVVAPGPTILQPVDPLGPKAGRGPDASCCAAVSCLAGTKCVCHNGGASCVGVPAPKLATPRKLLQQLSGAATAAVGAATPPGKGAPGGPYIQLTTKCRYVPSPGGGRCALASAR